MREEVIKVIISLINDAMDVAIKAVQDEITAQGHVLSGQLRDNITKRTYAEAEKVISEALMVDYYDSVNFGVPASRIPYGGGSGGTSRYIQGLIGFFQARGKDLKEAKRAAFATANRHKMEGMPTRASFRFSSNGRRTGFIAAGTGAALNDMVAMMEQELPERFTEALIAELKTFKNLKVSA